jgi:hypothetical protein
MIDNMGENKKRKWGFSKLRRRTLAGVVHDWPAADCEVEGSGRRDVAEDYTFREGIAWLEGGHSGMGWQTGLT